jgi:GntR family transcriptional regulator, transcriptional repressor for pyruvate dehydrogenase complex
MPTSQLKEIKNVRLSDQVADQIQLLVFDGHLQPGEKMPSESELVQQLHVSRSTVREALRALESKGIIRVRSGTRAFVSEQPFTFNIQSEAINWLLLRRESLIQILQVREALEGLAASLLACSVSEPVLDELRAIVREQQKLIVDDCCDVDRLSELDIQFHQLISHASGNQLVDELVSSFVREFCTSNRAILYVNGTGETSMEEHSRIIDALATHDPVIAENSVRAHIARVHTEILQIQTAAE